MKKTGTVPSKGRRSALALFLFPLLIFTCLAPHRFDPCDTLDVLAALYGLAILIVIAVRVRSSRERGLVGGALITLLAPVLPYVDLCALPSLPDHFPLPVLNVPLGALLGVLTASLLRHAGWRRGLRARAAICGGLLGLVLLRIPRPFAYRGDLTLGPFLLAWLTGLSFFAALHFPGGEEATAGSARERWFFQWRRAQRTVLPLFLFPALLVPVSAACFLLTPGTSARDWFPLFSALTLFVLAILILCSRPRGETGRALSAGAFIASVMPLVVCFTIVGGLVGGFLIAIFLRRLGCRRRSWAPLAATFLGGLLGALSLLSYVSSLDVAAILILPLIDTAAFGLFAAYHLRRAKEESPAADEDPDAAHASRLSGEVHGGGLLDDEPVLDTGEPTSSLASGEDPYRSDDVYWLARGAALEARLRPVVLELAEQARRWRLRPWHAAVLLALPLALIVSLAAPLAWSDGLRRAAVLGAAGGALLFLIAAFALEGRLRARAIARHFSPACSTPAARAEELERLLEQARASLAESEPCTP